MHFDVHPREDREARFLASKMSIVASFRSWSGKRYPFIFNMSLSVYIH